MTRRALFAVAVLAVCLLVVAPADAHAARRFRVSASPSTSQVILGGQVVIAGRVAPGRKGQKVILQTRDSASDRWAKVRTAVIKRGGTYRVSTVPRSAGTHLYRVIKPAKGNRRSGVSKALLVRVSSWRYLTDMNAHDSSGVNYGDPVRINGSSFIKSIVNWYSYGGDTTTYVEYNLDRQCQQLVATYGLSDDSATGSRATVDVSVDGASIYQRDFGVGESEKKMLDVHAAMRLRVTFVQTALGAQYEAAHGAAGAPTLLCAS